MEDNLKYITAPPHIKEKSDVTKLCFALFLHCCRWHYLQYINII